MEKQKDELRRLEDETSRMEKVKYEVSQEIGINQKRRRVRHRKLNKKRDKNNTSIYATRVEKNKTTNDKEVK